MAVTAPPVSALAITKIKIKFLTTVLPVGYSPDKLMGNMIPKFPAAHDHETGCALSADRKNALLYY